MKKALYKDAVKEIKNTYKRFISILLMAFLGVGFFAGIRATSPDMINTLHTYYEAQNFYDIQVLSTLGLTQEDIDAIKQIDGVKNVVGTYETDAVIELERTEIIAKVMCIEEINQPVLLEGRMPEKSTECLVEESFLKGTNKNIGDSIQVEIEDTTNEEQEKIPYLKEKEMTIVGTVRSPLYLTQNKGTSKLGAGKINYYILIPKENINASETFTQIYITIENVDKLITSSTVYEEKVNEIKTQIENLKEERQQARYDKLVGNANQKVEEAQAALDKEKQDAQTKIQEATQEIENGKKEIEDGEIQLANNEQKVQNEFANATKQIQSGKQQIEQSEKEFLEKQQQAEQQFEELELQKQDLQTQLGSVKEGLQTIDNNCKQIEQALQNPLLPEEEKIKLEQQKQELEKQKTSLTATKSQIEDGITAIDTGISSGRQELQEGSNQIQQAKKELESKEEQFYATKKTTTAQLQNARSELEEAKQKILDGEKELQENTKEFEEKIKEAEAELVDAREKIAEIEHPKWYVLDRNANTGYASFIQDTESVANIGKVFPIVFFIVATLISLTSMTRMVEEQRTQIGTLKALGYYKLQIATKYIIYASLACILGGILGMGVGFVLIPKVIWMMYEMLYQISDIVLSFDWYNGSIGLVLMSFCMIGATIYVAWKELVNTPATLMRPKAPKMGKRVLLERITWIWKRLSFSQKVTIRNIFRYKKRVLMTIIGILGCTSLILAGFGLKDSISQIMPNQFEKVFSYDMQISLKSGLDKEQQEQIKQYIQSKEEVGKSIETYMSSGTVKNGDLEEDVQIIVPKEKNEIKDIINLVDITSKQQINLPDDGVCLTDKAAQLLGVKVGDWITLIDTDEEEKQVKISYVVENYVSHYIYLSSQVYEELYQKDYETNVILVQNKELSAEQEDNFATDLIGQNEVATVNRISTMVKSMDDTLKSLNYVVLVLIVSAGLLAFVVLYNLSNVNISERIRELATIKVLGFYDKEVYSYVTRETILLTLIGITLGLIGGYFLSYFIIDTCETNMLRFNKVVEPISYVYATLITIAFTVIVNIVTYFALKKIDMIESLKSVE